MIDPEIGARTEAEEDPKPAEGPARRIRAGERVDVEGPVRHYPGWAETIQKMMPAIRDLAAPGRVPAGDPGASPRYRRGPSDAERPRRAHREGPPRRNIGPGLRFAPWPLVAAALAASGCGEGPPPKVNEPPEVAALRAQGKAPWEIRQEIKAMRLKKELKGVRIPARPGKD